MTLVVIAPVMAVDLEDAIVKAAIYILGHLRYVEAAFHKSQAQPLEKREEAQLRLL